MWGRCVAEALDLGRRERALEVQVQLHPRELEQVGKEQLRLQSRGLHALFGKEFGAALDSFQDRHSGNLGRRRAKSSSASPYSSRGED